MERMRLPAALPAIRVQPALSVIFCLLVFVSGATAAVTRRSTDVEQGPDVEPRIRAALHERTLSASRKLPLSFVQSAYTGGEGTYLARSAGVSFAFSPVGITLSVAKRNVGHALQLSFVDASPRVELDATRKLAGTVNYLIGNDRANWRTGVPTYGSLVYRGLWPGIDLYVRGSHGTLKYEFHLAPGARVSDIRVGYLGATHVSIERGGEVRLTTPLGTLTDSAPRSYQTISGKRQPVPSRYVLEGKSVHFELGRGYDATHPLIIDPGLVYSTFLGGVGDDFGFDVEVDSSGYTYVTGGTNSADFQTTPGAFDTTGGADAFVTKLNPAGSALVYSTFLGGSTGDGASDLAIDGSGSVYVTGGTDSADFPTTPGAFDKSRQGDVDSFIVKLNPSGSGLEYSTLLGGTERHCCGAGESIGDVAVGPDGSAYVTGDTDALDFPTTPGAFDRTKREGDTDAVVTRLNPAGSALVYSTFLGEIGFDQANDIQVDRAGNAFVVGSTDSVHFPTTPGAFDRGFKSMFVTKLNSAGSALVYSTFLGGGGGEIEIPEGLAIDGGGSVYVTGQTDSGNFPTTPGAFDRKISPPDAFVTKLNPAGSALVYSTFLGGGRPKPTDPLWVDIGWGLALDQNSNAYVTGGTNSPDFPTTPGSFDRSRNSESGDVFLAKLNVAGAALVYSTFLGGRGADVGLSVAVDSEGRAYVTGVTRASPRFPTTRGAFDRTFGGGYEGFVAKLDARPGPCVVPRLVGTTLAEARSRIRRANCALGTLRYANSSRARGRVIAQKPRPGTKLRPRGRVKLVVSKGR
jgi:hypothetical protein